ncbi:MULTISPECIES: phospholipase domain-containing protein [unclassified Streptomyces]|uniref:phospholipase domain-containing protein n=1 Tax=unclassified Streptomyces TaxID=2593676 RepID=UPI00210B5DD5|nr:MULTISPECIES: phospholipase domain-containing protein [unclassified Streptomyces]
MSAFDFGTKNTAFPSLPDTAALVAACDAENSLPDAAPPATPVAPVQESGTRPARPLGYGFDTTSWTDTSTGRIWFKTVATGTLGGGFTAYTVNYRGYDNWRYTLPSGGSISDYFSAQTYGGGLYDIDLHGPDGYLRGFKGDVRTWSSTSKAHPEAALSIAPAAPLALTVTLTNSGPVAATFTVGPNAYTGTGGSAVPVPAGGTRTVVLGPASDGNYDYTVTADVGDGFERRFAGRTYPV